MPLWEEPHGSGFGYIPPSPVINDGYFLKTHDRGGTGFKGQWTFKWLAFLND